MVFHWIHDYTKNTISQYVLIAPTTAYYDPNYESLIFIDQQTIL